MDDEIEDKYYELFQNGYDDGYGKNYRSLKFTEHEKSVLIHEYGFVVGTAENVDCACHVISNTKQSVYVVPAGTPGMFTLTINKHSYQENKDETNEPINFHILLSTLSDIITL